MADLREALKTLTNGGLFRTPTIVEQTPRADIDMKGFEEPLRLATIHLKPLLQIINIELLGGRGSLSEARHRGMLNACMGGWELVWDRNGRAGRSLELGVQEGSYKQIYLIHGRDGSSVIFAHLYEDDGKENPDWRAKTNAYLVDLLQNQPNWLEFH